MDQGVRWLIAFVYGSRDFWRMAEADKRKADAILSVLAELLDRWRAGAPFALTAESAQRTIITVAEVSEILGIGAQRVRKIATRLGGVHIGRDWAFPRERIEAEARRREKRKEEHGDKIRPRGTA